MSLDHKIFNWLKTNAASSTDLVKIPGTSNELHSGIKPYLERAP